MFTTFQEARSFVEQQNIQMVDLKFTDLWGRWHHLTIQREHHVVHIDACTSIILGCSPNRRSSADLTGRSYRRDGGRSLLNCERPRSGTYIAELVCDLYMYCMIAVDQPCGLVAYTGSGWRCGYYDTVQLHDSRRRIDAGSSITVSG